MNPSSRRRAFTLLEMCIVLFLVVVLMSVAVPSLSGQLGRRRLQGAFDRLELLVAEARERSMNEGKAYRLVWGGDGAVSLYPADLSAPARRKAGAVSKLFAAKEGGRYTLLRGAALAPEAAPEWTFWPTGTCEPVSVRYEGAAGHWEAAFNPLSGRGTFNQFIAL